MGLISSQYLSEEERARAVEKMREEVRALQIRLAANLRALSERVNEEGEYGGGSFGGQYVSAWDEYIKPTRDLWHEIDQLLGWIAEAES